MSSDEELLALCTAAHSWVWHVFGKKPKILWRNETKFWHIFGGIMIMKHLHTVQGFGGIDFTEQEKCPVVLVILEIS